jgi:hypothetical protein
MTDIEIATNYHSLAFCFERFAIFLKSFLVDLSLVMQTLQFFVAGTGNIYCY